ncbi:MAG: hypothetical protein HUU46_21515 [Candidatus Hydrogenedentes bacterium]|nr:hypothetical protein [Candidatus Hydrogenedentota bacterium]
MIAKRAILLAVCAMRAAFAHDESIADFRSVNGKSPFVYLGEIFRGTGNAADFDVSVENGYYVHEKGSPDHYLFFTGRNLAQDPVWYLVGYAKSDNAFGPYKTVRRLTELEANGVKSLSNVCVIKHNAAWKIFHDSVLGYIGATPALIRYAETRDLDSEWTPRGVALGTGAKGRFDDNYLIDTRVVHDGSRWRHYYTSPRNVFDTTRAQGCAVSDDLADWRRISEDPILDSDIEGLAIFPYGGRWILMGCGPSYTPGPVPFRTKIYESPDGLTDWRLVSTGEDFDCSNLWPGTFNFNRDENGLPFVIVSQTGRDKLDPQPMLLAMLATVPEPGAELLVAKASFHSKSKEMADAAEIAHTFADGRIRFWVRMRDVREAGAACVYVRRPALQDKRGGARGYRFEIDAEKILIASEVDALASTKVASPKDAWIACEILCAGYALAFRTYDATFRKAIAEATVSCGDFASGSVAIGTRNADAEFARVEIFPQ